MKIKLNQHKMGKEELQSYLKAKCLGNGAWKDKKKYDRKRDKKVV